MAVVGWLVNEAMSSLSLSGAVVSVPVSAPFVVSSIERRMLGPGGWRLSVYETSEKPLLS